MKIGVIIPVVQREMYNQLVTSILRNTLRPSTVVVVDNSRYGVTVPIGVGNINWVYIRNEPKFDEDNNFIPGNGTNEAWKQGMAALGDTVDLVSFFNDDILINPLFFEKTYQTFDISPKLGYLIPATHGDKDFVLNYQQRQNAKVRKTKERNGWCMTIRQPLLSSLPTIPEGMTIWYGDNWFADLTVMYGYQRVMRLDNPVFHYGGTTSKQETQRKTAKVNSKKRRGEHDVFLRAIRKIRQEKEEKEIADGLKNIKKEE